LKKIKASPNYLNFVVFLLFGCIALEMICGCAKPHGKLLNASSTTIEVLSLDAMTTKEPQPFFKPAGQSSTANTTDSKIVLVDLRHNEVWLIVKLKVTSPRKVRLRNMADIVFISPAGTSFPGCVEERIFSLLNPSRDNYEIVWDSLNSEYTILPGTSELKVVFKILDGSVSQGRIKILSARPVRIHEFFEQ
jgi:hypothetical protein